MPDEAELRNDLKKLLSSQRLAVLATQEEIHPYLSLVAFAETDDLKVILFATTRSTRKYANMLSDSGVALLVDNRSNEVADVHDAVAVTIMGKATEVLPVERRFMEEIYLAKLPHMKDFLADPTTALVRVDVETYYMVSQFQNVEVLDLRS
jgi:heme iron utilization protein